MSLQKWEMSDTSVAQRDQRQTDLVEELRQLTEDEPTETTQAQLRAAVNELFSLLPVQFEFKSCDDYLGDVTDEYPNWDTQVRTLRVEQALLYEDLREIRDRLEEGDSAPSTSITLMPLIKDWVCRLQTHETEERRLSQIAANLDVGGQDG
jgi:hypothetical protein